MSLAFLAKKSWHTSNLDNVEKVWKAEQKAAMEEKKLAEWKKNIEEERQLKELRELQAKVTGTAADTTQRVDWMYEGPMAGTQREKTTEEYLLGKEYNEKPEENELKKLSSKPGSLYMNGPTAKMNDSFSRLNEDPMMFIKKQQKAAQLDILKNPMKMKRIKDKVEEELKQRKAEKKAKKEAKKSKKELKKKSRESSSAKHGYRDRTPSPDKTKKVINHRDFDDERSSDDNRRQRSRSGSRRVNRRNEQRERSPRGRSRDRYDKRSDDRYSHRYDRRDSRPREDSFDYTGNTRRDRSSRRSRSPMSPRRDRREPSRDRSPLKEKLNRQERPEPLKGYGLLGAENARKCRDIDTTSLGPSRRFLDQAMEKRKREEEEREERFKRARAVTEDVSKEDKEKRIKAMLEDAKRREEALESRLKRKQDEHIQGDGMESKTQQNPAFLRDLHDSAYINSKESMEDRLQRNKHYMQRNADSKNFMEK